MIKGNEMIEDSEIDKVNSDLEHVTFVEYLEVLVKYLQVIIKITLIVFVATMFIVFIIPKTYMATALILPPQQNQDLLSNMIGQGGLTSLAGDLLGGTKSAELYVGMLKSETIKDALIDRYKLMDVYGKENRVDTYETLNKYVNIDIGKNDGIISIGVEDKDPSRAADMANTYISELEKLIIKLGSADASQNRKYIERRIAKTKIDLKNAEENLKAFEVKNKAPAIVEQAKGSIESVAQLKAQQIYFELQLASARSRYTDSSGDVKLLKANIDALKKQITAMEYVGRASSIPNMGSVPSLMQEYVGIMRDYKVQEALLELLTRQYEMSKYTEDKDMANIQIIQKARVPDKKYKPKRIITVLFVTFVGLLCSIIGCFIFENIRNMDDARKIKYKQLKTDFKKSLLFR